MKQFNNINSCLFCQIIARESLWYKIYENNNLLAFWDIYPRTKGHTLVIPKKHYHWVYDVKEFDQYWQTVLKITRAVQQGLKPLFVTYITYGLEIPHAHIHIIPRYKNRLGHYIPIIDLAKKDFKKIQTNIAKFI